MNAIVEAPPSERYWVGGSSIAAILGLPGALQTPLQVYQTIIGTAPALDEDDRKFFERRRRVEPFVIAILEEERGMKVLQRNHRYTHQSLAHLKAEIDVEVLCQDQKRRNVEIKSVHFRATDPWGESGDDSGAPVHVVAQAMWGLGFTGVDEAIAWGQIGFDDDRDYLIHRDQETIDMMFDRADRFWTHNVMKRVAPDPVSPADASRMWPTSRWRKVVGDGSLAQALRSMRDLDVQIASLAQQRDVWKLKVQQTMKDADLLVDDSGRSLASWRSSKSSTEVDYPGYCATLEAKLAPLLMLPGEIQDTRAKFSKPVPGVRTFRNMVKA